LPINVLARREFFRSRDNTEKQLTILREQGDIRYPEQVEDFLDFLTDAELKPTGSTPKFQQLADKIESDILSKNQIFYKPTVLQGKEIKVKVNQGLTIDLYNASSSIKQITPLLLYLRYHAKPNDLLIIDEPEMNLHPESQAKLLEVFAILVNFGVNVLLTTHSPYFMDHLNSLVSGKINHPQVLQTQANALYLKDARAFLAFDKVSAYEMKDNQLSSLKDEDDDIRWDTLSDVSHDLQHKYFKIYEKGKAAR
jgi:predicted ATP-dependent endonuclease of OLD family